VSNVYPFLPKLTMNGQFIRDFIAAESPWLNSNKGTKCDIESRATRMLAGVQLFNLQFLSALAPSLAASFALRPGDRSDGSVQKNLPC